MKKIIKDYLKKLKFPHYHEIILIGDYLKMSYQDLYLSGNTVFNHYDKISKININKFDEISIKKIIDNFIKNGKERIKTKPYQISIIQDIDDIDYTNIWDFQYSDEGLKDRWLNNEGRCNY